MNISLIIFLSKPVRVSSETDLIHGSLSLWLLWSRPHSAPGSLELLASIPREPALFISPMYSKEAFESHRRGELGMPVVLDILTVVERHGCRLAARSSGIERAVEVVGRGQPGNQLVGLVSEAQEGPVRPLIGRVDLLV